MDQALAVDEGQGLRDHAPQAVHLLDLQLVPRAQRLREVLARDELGHHAALPVDLGEAEDLDQVRMGEASGGLEVGHQGLEDSRAAQQRGGQHPQRDVAAVALLHGAEDRAQGAGADLLLVHEAGRAGRRGAAAGAGVAAAGGAGLGAGEGTAAAGAGAARARRGP